MGKVLSAPEAYLRRHRRRIVAGLKDFIGFASVSAQAERQRDVRRCANWLADRLGGIGLTGVRIFETSGHPIVYAEWMGAVGSPTVLVYGHYDVQPAEPLAQWRTPPFVAKVVGSDIHGRGASDNKGQMWVHLNAIESLLATEGRLPVNVRCLFEGEEEIGSPNLPSFVERQRRDLSADLVVVSDTRMLAQDQPALTYALRGGISFEVEISGQRMELHSGSFGGAVHNPVQALCEVIAGLHDSRGRIAIEGFYDRVRCWSKAERSFMAANGPTNREILRDAGATIGWGEASYSLYERTTIRPALSITGIRGGYQGEGVKSIIPARASAKLNFRLVPDQDPLEIEQLFKRHLERWRPRTVHLTIRRHLLARPALIDRHHPAMESAAIAYQRGFGVRPVKVRSGGTIPIVSTFQETLGVPVVLMGFGLPDDRIHAPNEKFHLPNLFRGADTSIAFFHEVGARRDQFL